MDQQIASTAAVLEISVATESQQDEIRAFVAPAFTGPGTPDVLNSPQMQRWKAVQPHPGWDGRRNYTLRQNHRIAAHACLWPTGFRTSSGDVTCSHILDWAADPTVAGSGVAVYRHLMQLTDIVLAIGGSAQARRLLPRIGFKPYATLDYYARVIRPIRQYLSRPKASAIREMARLGRNIIWSFPAAHSQGSYWSAIHRPAAGTWLDDVVSQFKPQSFCAGSRSSTFVNYLLSCPAAACSLYSLSSRGFDRGYFILNEVRGQTRIIDLFLKSEDPRDWKSAFRVAVATAASIASTCEISMATSLPWFTELLRTCGFRKCNDRPVMLYDPRGLLVNAPPLNIQMVDSDAYYLHDLSYPFLT